MSVEDINDEFAQWNPMEKDFKSVEFNKYNTGPGAELDLELQAGQQATQKATSGNNRAKQNGPKPYLMFRELPKGMTTTALYNICSRHGQVLEVRDSRKNDYYFVDLASVADMEAVYRALEHNNYGFKVNVGRQQNKTPMNMERERRDQPIAPVPPRSVGIDYDSRTYRISHKQNPRPEIKDNSTLKAAQISQLPLKLIADDAHSLEREGLYKFKNNNKFNYHNGRSYVKMPEQTKEFVNKKHSESSGRYSPTRGNYVNTNDEGNKHYKVGKCLNCERQCDTICSRCGVYYCCVECQKTDWQQHRYMCGKPKHMQKTPPPRKEVNKSKSLNNNNKESSSSPAQKTTNNNEQQPISEKDEYKKQMPRSGNVVTITAISKTNVVFIRSKTYEDNTSYFKTIDDLQTLGDKLKPLKTLPKQGNVVVAKFENKFNRAIVLQVNDNDQILVNYMDYGNLDRLNLGDLYEAPVEYVNKPRHAIPVLLKDVPDCYMTEEIRNFMYTYLNNISVYVKYKQEDFYEDNSVFAVELIDENTEQNLNKIITKLAKPVEPRTSEDICQRDYLEHKVLPSGENVEFIVMDNSLMMTGCISCTITAYAKEIQKFQTELQTYVDSIPKVAYAPRVDELCVAKYNEDDLWYRGRCLEVVGDGHPTIMFIDYGNIEMIKIEDIRRYPPQLTYPIYTADCEIQGLPEACDEKLVAKLEKLIPNGSIIKCASVKAFEEDNFYSISLPAVTKELAACGLI